MPPSTTSIPACSFRLMPIRQRVAGAKRSILTMAYDTLGMIDMNKKDYRLRREEPAEGHRPEPRPIRRRALSAALGCAGQAEAVSAGAGLGQQSGAIRQGRNRGAEPGEAAAGARAEADELREHLPRCSAPAGAASPCPRPVRVAVPAPTPGSRQTPVAGADVARPRRAKREHDHLAERPCHYRSSHH